MNTFIVVTHVIGAVSAWVLVCLQLPRPKGTPTHRWIGRLYLVAWAVLSSTGILIGRAESELSVFELLNILGFGFVLLGFAILRMHSVKAQMRRELHYIFMLTSVGFLSVATANQLLPRMGITYPSWVFFAMIGLSFVVVTGAITHFNRVYHSANARKSLR